MSLATETARTGGETRIAVKGVGWNVYESWVDSLPERTPIRMAYDGRNLEIMVKGPLHENFRDLLGRFVRVVSSALAIPVKGLGETTWKRPEVERGLEADQCYFFSADKIRAVNEALGAAIQRRRRLSESRSCDRGRSLAVANRPAGNLCGTRDRRGLGIRRRDPHDRPARSRRHLSSIRLQPLATGANPRRSCAGCSTRIPPTRKPGRKRLKAWAREVLAGTEDPDGPRTQLQRKVVMDPRSPVSWTRRRIARDIGLCNFSSSMLTATVSATRRRARGGPQGAMASSRRPRPRAGRAWGWAAAGRCSRRRSRRSTRT